MYNPSMDVTPENAVALIENCKANMENLNVDLNDIKVYVGNYIVSGMEPHAVDRTLVRLDKISATLASLIQTCEEPYPADPDVEELEVP